jgi:protein TonB
MKKLTPFFAGSLFFHLLVILSLLFIFRSDEAPLPGGSYSPGGGGGTVQVDIVGLSSQDRNSSPNRPLIRLPGQTNQGLRSRPAQNQRPSLSGAAKASPKNSGPASAGSGTGSGSGVGAGSGEGNGTSLVLSQIRSRIERAKRYPLLAKKSGVEGASLVRFEINEKGEPTGIVLKTSSGSEMLDNEAIETIHRAAPYPVYPDPLEVWIRFQLNRL